MAITLTQLRTFLAVVRGGSIRRAAEELVVTQPSVSAALAALAREVGVPLTERAGRGVRVTPAGEVFASYAADVVGLLEHGRRAAHEAAGTAARELRIAAVTTAAEHLAPPLLQAFAERNGGVRLTLEVGNRERVFRRLDEHEVDVVLGGRAPAGARTISADFLPNELVLVIRPGDELARAPGPVPPSALGARTWLLREEGSGTRSLNEQFLADHDLTPPVLTLGSNGAIKQAARAGLGISLVSQLTVGLELDAGLLAAVPIAGIQPRRWFVHRSAVGPPRPLVDAFTAFVLSPDARAAIERSREFPARA